MTAEEPKTGPETDHTEPRGAGFLAGAISKQSYLIPLAVSITGALLTIIAIIITLIVFTSDLVSKDDLDRANASIADDLKETNRRLNAVIDGLLQTEKTLSDITDSLDMSRFKLDFGPFIKLNVSLINNSYRDELLTAKVPMPEIESPEIVSTKTDSLLYVARLYLSFDQASFSKYVLNLVTDFYDRNSLYRFTKEQKATIKEIDAAVANVDAENPLTYLED